MARFPFFRKLVLYHLVKFQKSFLMSYKSCFVIKKSYTTNFQERVYLEKSPYKSYTIPRFNNVRKIGIKEHRRLTHLCPL